MPDNSEMIVEHGKENAKSKCASCDRVGSSVPQMINSLRRLNLQLAFICKGEEHPYEVSVNIHDHRVSKVQNADPSVCRPTTFINICKSRRRYDLSARPGNSQIK